MPTKYLLGNLTMPFEMWQSNTPSLSNKETEIYVHRRYAVE